MVDLVDPGLMGNLVPGEIGSLKDLVVLRQTGLGSFLIEVVLESLLVASMVVVALKALVDSSYLAIHFLTVIVVVADLDCLKINCSFDLLNHCLMLALVVVETLD